jgi:hypothetical protein
MAICYNSGIQRKVDMDIRVRAAVKTLGILGYMAIMVVAIQVVLKYASVELLQYSVATLAIGGLVYWMYTIVLDRLRSQEILDNLNSKG